VWKRQAAGRTLAFHLAGINNQNFIMRDDQTGSFWQQVDGRCISGPLTGSRLQLVPMDELTFGLWKQESPHGEVLAPVPAYVADYDRKDWEARMQKVPTVVSVSGTPLAARETVIGISLNGASRAFSLDKVLAESPIQDSVGGAPLVLVAGPDGKSIRVFLSRLPGNQPAQFFKSSSGEWDLIDSVHADHWNFQGCATSGPDSGKCLEEVNYLKDYWFDWHLYHPGTTIYSR
jgi:hypothetical protein